MSDVDISTLGTVIVSAIPAASIAYSKLSIADGSIPNAKLVEHIAVQQIPFTATQLAYVLSHRCIGAWMRPGAQGGAGGGAGGAGASANVGGGGGGSAGRAGGSCALQFIALDIAAGTSVDVT